MKEEDKKQEMLLWIEEYGSNRLNMMLEKGYDYIKTYEDERTKKEFPWFFANNIPNPHSWKKRENPSLEALDMLNYIEDKYASLKAEIVELIAGGYGATPSDQEVIVIKPEWSRIQVHLLLHPQSWVKEFKEIKNLRGE